MGKGHSVIKYAKVLSLAVGIGAGCWSPAWAETTAKDAEAAIRTLRQLAVKPVEPVVVAVVCDPASPASKAEAASLMAMMQAGKVAGIAIAPKLVVIDHLDELKGAVMALLTSGTEARREAIFKASSSNGVVSVSADPACAQAGQCVMAVQAEPKVKIILSDAAAKASRIEFAATFRMMISEI